MLRPSASLGAVVGTVLAVVAALALATACALVLLTTELRRTTGQLRAVLESVRIAEEAETALLLRERTDEPAERRAIEAALREKLGRAAAYARSDGQRAVLAPAVERVNAYLDARDPGRQAIVFDDAFAALAALVAANEQEAREADARAHRLDRVGDAIGVGVAVVLVVTMAWLLWWLRTRAVNPLLGIADAMKRFGAGNAAARAPEAGPAELRSMARQFNEMAASLEALRQRQMTFLAALAHDLRNPLSALKLATARGGKAAAGAADPSLAIVRRQVTRLERLVSDFLDTARIEAGQLDMHPESVDLRPIVQGVVSLFGATSSTHTITVRLPDEKVMTRCDPARLEQVLNNLVSNAIKYSPAGGHIDVILEPQPHAVRMAVADEGLGIADGEVSAIFDPFRRGSAVARDIPGVGLGLYVSKRIVEAHGGAIHVASTPGHGSTFEVVLPR